MFVESPTPPVLPLEPRLIPDHDLDGGEQGVAPVIKGKEVARFKAYLALVLTDSVVIAFAFLFANAAWLNDISSPHGLSLLIAILPLFLGVNALSDGYSAEVITSPRAGVYRSVRALAFTLAAVLFIAYFLKASAEFSRIVFGLGSTTALVLLVAGRQLVARALARRFGGSPFATVVVTDGVSYRPKATDFLVRADQLDFDPRTQDPVKHHDFAKVVAGADRLIVACPVERRTAWASVLKGLNTTGEIICDIENEIGAVGYSQYRGDGTFVIASGPLHLRARILKRMFDFAVALSAIIVLAPLLAVVCLLIKVDSRGPVFFVQQRIGRNNELFNMFKFRTMYSDLTDANASQLTRRDDHRVTRIGKFLRRTSIDELPQLINVLLGSMSIVGPRPHALSAKAADLLYWDIDPRYRHRHALKPGLTGLAQIRGFRGATEHYDDLTNRLQADLEYAAGWSLWHDLAIILRTINVVSHKNAF